MNGQSNDCLSVCNVKMKNNNRVEMRHISENVWVTGL